MTQTKYEDQKSNHMSWIQWINMNLDNAKEFYEEVKMNLREITSQIISRVGKELRFFISKLTTVDFFLWEYNSWDHGLCLTIFGFRIWTCRVSGISLDKRWRVVRICHNGSI